VSAFELGPIANQVNAEAKKVMATVNKYVQKNPAARVVSVSQNDFAHLLAGVNRVLERQGNPATNATHLAHRRVHIKART